MNKKLKAEIISAATFQKKPTAAALLSTLHLQLPSPLLFFPHQKVPRKFEKKNFFQDLSTLPQAISKVFYLEEEIKEDYGKTVLKKPRF